MAVLGKTWCLVLVCVFICAFLQEEVAGQDEEVDSWELFGSWDAQEEKRAPPAAAGRTSALGNQPVNHDHANHDHGNHLHSQGAAPAYENTGSGMQGANNAGHGEICNQGKVCWAESWLVCNATTGRCVCSEGHIYVRETETCWKIPKSEQEECAHDIQCQSGMWGHNARCNKQTARCECYDREGWGNREMKLVNGKCYVVKSVGVLCNNDEECDATIEGEAYCAPGDQLGAGGSTYKGSCQCRDGSMHWKPSNACLRIATKPNDKCTHSEQCTPNLNLARCSGSGYCQCYKQDRNGTELPMVFYDKVGQCFVRREYNSSCTSADECRASLGPDVECGKIEPETTTPSMDIDARPRNVCYCPKGKVCTNGAFSNLHSISLTTPILLGIVYTACSKLMAGVM